MAMKTTLLIGMAISALAMSCREPASHPKDEPTSETEDVEEAPTPSAARVELPNVTPLSSATIPPLDKEAVEKELKDPKAVVTSDLFESALLFTSACEGGFGYLTCKEGAELKNLRDRPESAKIDASSIAARHLRHPSPGVRCQAADIVARELFGTSPKRTLDSDAGKAFLSALYSETDPPTLSRFIDLAREGAVKSFAVRKMVLDSMEHSAYGVRLAAVRALTFQKNYNEILPAKDLLLKTLAHDPEELVKRVACAELGGVNDLDMLEPIRKVMDDPASSGELRGACFEGIVRLWTGHPQPVQPSEAAYEIAMRVLTAVPRNEQTPNYRGILALGSASGRYDEEWLAKVRPFYRRGEMMSALEAIALDTNAGKSARSVAVNVLEIWREREQLEDLLEKLNALPDPTSRQIAEVARKSLAKISTR
jgi:hypothetical protein